MTDAEVSRLSGEALRGDLDSRSRLFRWVYEQALIYVKWKSKTYKQLRYIERFEDVALDLLLMFAERLHRLDNPAHYLKTLIKFETIRAGKNHEKYHMAMLIGKVVPLRDRETTETPDPPFDDDDLIRLRAASDIFDGASKMCRECILLRMRGLKFREIAQMTGYANTQSAVSVFAAYRKQVKQRYKEIAA